jgi:hypothetical protein
VLLCVLYNINGGLLHGTSALASCLLHFRASNAQPRPSAAASCSAAGAARKSGDWRGVPAASCHLQRGFLLTA